MGQLLLEQHQLRTHQLGIAIAERFGLKFVDLKGVEPDLAALNLLPEAAMHRLEAVPVGFRSVLVAMEDPRNLLATDDIAMLTNRNVVPVVVTREDLDSLLARTDDLGDLVEEVRAQSEEDEAAREQAADDRPTVRLVRSVIARRSPSVSPTFTSIPTTATCSCASASLSLGELGMDDADRVRVEAALRRAHGAILATGPTGSGKSTTLYASIGAVSTPEKTIMTIEDPVEYRLPRVKQMQVFERAGVTFASGLRSIVRADPDIIMVGEMRDRESAKIAIEAALTGHLMLSSLHTNSAPAAVARLVDMGIEPYLVASALECVVGQRLVRRLCPECRHAVTVPAADAGLPAGDEDVVVYEPRGCAQCGETGYRGRAGIYEG